MRNIDTQALNLTSETFATKHKDKQIKSWWQKLSCFEWKKGSDFLKTCMIRFIIRCARSEREIAFQRVWWGWKNNFIVAYFHEKFKGMCGKRVSSTASKTVEDKSFLWGKKKIEKHGEMVR